MASNDKILKALESSANHLEKSVSAMDNRDEDSFAKHFWHVAAELEYALFMFSLIFQEENVDKSRWKHNPDIKKGDLRSALAEVGGLLDNAKKLLTSGKVFDAYRVVYVARHCVFAIEENLARKKRESLKAK